MTGLLDGRTAVVTGAARGIGLEIARAFLDAGASVVIGDIDAEAGAEAVADLTAGRDGGPDTRADRVRYTDCDVRDAAQVDAMIDLAEEAFGPLAVFVNNAGITRDATMSKMTEEQFDDVVAIHLKGCWNGTRLAAARMREHGGGSIVNLSSISGKVGLRGQTNYSAAKAGIVGLTKAAAKEVAFKNVRVNAVQPGLIKTAMTLAMPEKVWDEKMAEIPMGRAAEPAEVAQVVLFLASDMSSYMTGTVLEITGGRHI